MEGPHTPTPPASAEDAGETGLPGAVAELYNAGANGQIGGGDVAIINNLEFQSQPSERHLGFRIAPGLSAIAATRLQTVLSSEQILDSAQLFRVCLPGFVVPAPPGPVKQQDIGFFKPDRSR